MNFDISVFADKNIRQKRAQTEDYCLFIQSINWCLHACLNILNDTQSVFLNFNEVSGKKKKQIKSSHVGSKRLRHQGAWRLLPGSTGKSSSSKVWSLQVGQVLCSFSHDLIHWTQTKAARQNQQDRHDPQIKSRKHLFDLVLTETTIRVPTPFFQSQIQALSSFPAPYGCGKLYSNQFQLVLLLYLKSKIFSRIAIYYIKQLEFRALLKPWTCHIKIQAFFKDFQHLYEPCRMIWFYSTDQQLVAVTRKAA